MSDSKTTITSKITKEAIRSDKARNFFVIAAISLTTFMITSIFSMGMSYIESLNMQALRMQGSASQFAFYQPTEKQMESVYNLDYVRHVGVAHYIGTIDDYPQLGDVIFAYVDKTHWDEMFSPTFINIVGKYAEAENEVMISRYTLAAMGIDNPILGMEIPITFTNFLTDEEITETFILSLIYTDFGRMRSPGINQSLGIYTSYETADKFGANILENTMINIIFNNRIAEYADKLIDDLSFYTTQAYAVAPILNNVSHSISLYLGFVAITAFLMLSGYLLIYNVMYISVSKDIRFYGLLKTLGMTNKQISRIVIEQSIRLCIIGIPIGLIVTSLLSFLIVPILIETDLKTGAVISFSPIIYIGGVIFTILTVYLASVSPSKKAAKVSPIEGMRHVAENQNRSIQAYHSSANGKPLKIAVRNMNRNPKRLRITVLSLFIGIAVFTSAATLSNSMDIEYNLDKEYLYDFMLVSSRMPYGTLDDKFVDAILNEFGDKAHISALIHGEFVNTNEISKHVEFISKRDNLAYDEVIEQLFDKYYLGLKTTDLRMLTEVTDGALKLENIEAFNRGELAFFSTRGFEEWNEGENNWIYNEVRMNTFDIGSILEINIGPSKIPAQITFGGFVELMNPPVSGSTHRGTPEILVSNKFLEPFISAEHEENYASADILSISLDAINENEEEYYYHLLSNMLSINEQLVSRIDAKRAFVEAMALLFVLGSGIAGILSLIGVFNFINVMSVSTIARKHEFALLECIGMCKKQVRQAIMYEGIGYGIISILLSATIGNLIAYALLLYVSNIDDAFRFNYPFVSVLIIYAIILAISFIVPALVYRSVSNATLVERLREVE